MALKSAVISLLKAKSLVVNIFVDPGVFCFLKTELLLSFFLQVIFLAGLF